MGDYYQTCPLAKPEPRKRVKARAKRLQAAHVKEIRAYVFAREDGCCRCCGWRRPTSLHEVRFRSQGGKVSNANSIAVCGDGVRGCHGLLQRHEIKARFGRDRSADGWMAFRPKTDAAASWMGWRDLMDCTERVSDATPRESQMALPPARTPIERLIDEACGIQKR